MTKRKNPRRTLLSLYTGAGGFDLGLEVAGFETLLCVEKDEDSRKTISINRPNWRLSNPGDVHKISPSQILDQAKLKPRQLTLLAGGPPCQPFSKSMYWSSGDAPRLQDPRSLTLQSFFDVVEVALPKIFLLENVGGLAYKGKDEGLQLIKAAINRINRKHGTAYKLQLIKINSANYGVPQFRERVFILACIDGREIELPVPTHGTKQDSTPYLTAWDAIGHLDVDLWPEELKTKGKWANLLPSIPEGKNYLWHTPRNIENGGKALFGWRTKFWSFLLKLGKHQPSWTIQAGPGPATGPFHWRSRLLSIEEMCCLQTFPRKYKIVGDRRSAHRQVGNAVPSAIGELFGLQIRKQILGDKVRSTLTLIPKRRSDCPIAEPVKKVPLEFSKLHDNHLDHPGEGLGPAAQRREKSKIQAWGS